MGRKRNASCSLEITYLLEAFSVERLSVSSQLCISPSHLSLLLSLAGCQHRSILALPLLCCRCLQRLPPAGNRTNPSSPHVSVLDLHTKVHEMHLLSSIKTKHQQKISHYFVLIMGLDSKWVTQVTLIIRLKAFNGKPRRELFGGRRMGS